MEKMFLIRFVVSGLKWLTSFTKTKWDDKVANTVYNVIVGSPELIKNAETIYNFGEAGLEEIIYNYKKDRSKTEVAKVLYKLVSNAPEKEIKKVISSAKKELKKNEAPKSE